jgi:hypothetical protein
MQPGSKWDICTESSSPSKEDKKRRLKRILGIVIHEPAATDTPDEWRVPTNQLGKCSLIPRGEEVVEQVPVGHIDW